MRRRVLTSAPRGSRFALVAFALSLLAAPVSGDAPDRLVSVDGAITEIIYVLKAEDALVGVDTTSLYPAAAQELASVGYKRALSAEGLLSLRPDLVLATDDAGPPEVLEQIAQAGVAIRRISDAPTVAGLKEKIRSVADALDRDAAGAALAAEIDLQLEDLAEHLRRDVPRPRVLFLLHIGSGNDLAAGRDTAIDTVIRLAGAENVLHDAFSGYKPLSPEAALAAAPDVILLTERNLDGLGGVEGVLGRAALAATPAGRAGRVIAMDGPLVLGFGPRLAAAVAALAGHLGTLSEPPRLATDQEHHGDAARVRR